MNKLDCESRLGGEGENEGRREAGNQDQPDITQTDRYRGVGSRQDVTSKLWYVEVLCRLEKEKTRH